MSAIFQELVTPVPTAGTPVAMGGDAVKFNWGMFYPAEGNTGNVAVRPAGGTGWNYIQPGETPWSLPKSTAGTVYSAADFEIDAAVDGEGVQLVYAFANPKTFSDIEMKLEAAMLAALQTLAQTIDDECTFTTGLTDDAAGPDNVHCMVDSSEEEIHNSGLWRCQASVTVKTSVDSNSTEDLGTRMARHRLRTAYVRDLFLDQNIGGIMSALAPRLTIQPNGIMRRKLTSGILPDKRQFISTLAMEILCCGNLSYA